MTHRAQRFVNHSTSGSIKRTAFNLIKHYPTSLSIKLLGWLLTLSLAQTAFGRTIPTILETRSATTPHLTFQQSTPQQSEDLKQLEEEAAKLKSERKYDQAIGVLTKALAIREKTGAKQVDIATALNELGELAFSAGKYDSAASFMTRALSIRETELPKDDPLLGESLSNLATVYIRQGDLVRSEPLLKRALSIEEAKLGPDSAEVAGTLNSLASLYEERGDLANAVALFKRSLAIREKLAKQDRSLANSLNNLGRVYMALRDFTSAEPLFKRSLKIREELLGREHPDLATPIINLATLQYEKGRFADAEPLFQRALQLQQKGLGATHPALINTLHNLAEVYRHERRFDEAESLYKQAQEVATNSLGNEHTLVANVLRGQALLEEARGNYVAAAPFLQRAIEVQERNLELILTAGSQSQKLRYLQTVADEADLAMSLHLRNTPNNPTAARLAITTLLQRKGRVLDVVAANLDALRQNAAPEDLALINDLANARSDLAKLTFAVSSATKSQAEIDKLQEKIDRLEAEISARSSRFRSQSQPVTLELVQQAIPRNASLIEFVGYRPVNVLGKTRAETFGPITYAAYILDTKGSPSWVQLGSAARIDRAVDRFRRSLRSSSNKDYKRAGRALDELVMRPVRRFLGPHRQLFISPDGILNLIPFAALVDERNRYLAQSYTITYLSSGRDLLRLQVKGGAAQRPVVVANPAFHDLVATNEASAESSTTTRAIDFRNVTVNPLPETALEAEAFKTLFPDAEMFTGSSASEVTVKKVNAPSIFHVATHGFFESDGPRVSGTRGVGISGSERSTANTNPLLRSGLLLAGVSLGKSGKGEDGILTALEVTNLNLWGTKLVVLSACETGLGDVYVGEGVFGLRRALVLAGAQSQIISLWKVSDLGTRELMTAYYNSIKQGASRADALRSVQLQMIGGARMRGRLDRKFTHPFYWAGFIQSGDWRAM